MKKIKIDVNIRQLLADIITPVGVYLKMRDSFPYAVLLESSDYHGGENSYSFIGLDPIARFVVENGVISEQYPNGARQLRPVTEISVPDALKQFVERFDVNTLAEVSVNGLFGYTAYDAVTYFETIALSRKPIENNQIPEVYYSLYKYVIAINHFKEHVTIIENLPEGEESAIDMVESLLNNRNFATYNFKATGYEESNVSDDEFIELVKRGKYHCQRGDVFQLVLSRQFAQEFSGDEFNVYRALRSINPSPYLFYFDYGSFRIFGSSPESQILVKNSVAYISPIAGTFKRTGNDDDDKLLAQKLAADPKENAEHTMLVDLARNDLSRNGKMVTVEKLKEIQFYSHVIHMVSLVSAQLNSNTSGIKVMADTFPAGTLTGAPKFKAMELIDLYENRGRGFYGGCIGYLGFNGDITQAITIRSFLSKNNTLYYQAGAGIVSESKEQSELEEVNNKLMALKRAIDLAAAI